MPKIQGKQIAEGTITQELLNLTTPTSGDTTSGATVDYVNNYMSSGSGVTAIGAAEDGTYTDGIFTDFVPTTPIGTAVDRFNEMLLLLAPTPPNTSWDGVFSNLSITSNQIDNMRIAGTTTVANNITTDLTPTYSVSVSLSSPQGQNGDTGTFTMSDDITGQLDQVILTSGDDTTSGIISLTESDPYVGQSGKEGFWSGVTAMSVNGTLASITAGITQHTLTYTHEGSGSPETYNYYVDTVSTPTVTSGSATFPTMTSYVSGVPGLATGTSVSAIAFTVNNAVSYFYNPTIFYFSGSNITNTSYTAPTATPAANSSFSETGHSTTISSGYAESISFNVIARNIVGTTGSGAISSSVYRIDTVSNETSRLLSAAGSYPATGWGGAFVSTTSLKTGAYVNELMLINGGYKYPSGNFSTYTDATNGAGPDYSTGISGTRWATFNLGSFTNNGAFTLTINGASGISTVGQANLLIEVMISGQTSWVDADAYYSGVGNPGSGANGVAAVVNGYSGTSATIRRITFGAITYTGAIIVRIGFTGTGPGFTSLSASALV